MPINKFPRLHRRSIRLQGYDYSEDGAYFLTICTKDRECLFGAIEHGIIRLNQFGNIVHDELLKTLEIRSEIELDSLVIMPNHIHVITVINRGNDVFRTDDICFRRGDRPVAPTGHRSGPKSQSIGSFVAGFKSAVTKRANVIRGNTGGAVWQRNYYEHIVRDEKSLSNIRTYIMENPRKWEEDELFVE
ncbi:MAG: transposase [Patescibacteria group bacterium]|jgi:REP element-mobilizing transposase RayT